EAAMIGMKLAPGLGRRFSAEAWGCLDGAIWERARSEALSAVDRTPFEVYGYDIDEKAVELTLENSRKAGVGGFVRAKKQEIAQFAPEQSRGTVVCNPPYGERMLEVRQAEEIYQTMGKVFLGLKNWNFYIISPSERFESLFGKKADKKRKLYNGMIKCELFQYFKR
ncbi:MAG TPA: class I SAM-dependent RNA methyltransferase, partial [Clostridia bacterium]|nr:class I SAM-dependent RNA methyltransferase [Clostridia bacterium]